MTIQAGVPSSWTVGRSSVSSSPTSNSTGSDTRVPEDDLEEIKRWSLTRQRPRLTLQDLLTTSKLTIPCLAVAARCSFQSVSSNTLMPATVSPSHSVNFDTVMVLSLGSASSGALCFRISTIWSRVRSRSWSRSWSCSNSKTSSASYARICALGLIYLGPEGKRRKSRRCKSGDYCIYMTKHFKITVDVTALMLILDLCHLRLQLVIIYQTGS